MLEEMWPGGVQPTTSKVDYKIIDDKLVLSCSTVGASIGYQIEGVNWESYTHPLNISKGHKLKFKAIRIGFKESEISSY